MKNIHTLPIHTTLIIDNNTSVLKVPDGLIYTIKTIETITNIKDNSKHTITNSNSVNDAVSDTVNDALIDAVYVPYNNNTYNSIDNNKPNPDTDLPGTQYTII